MKTVALSEVEAKLNELASDSRGEPVLVTRDGLPVGILYAVADPDEMERLALSHSPKFRALLESGRQQAREGKGLTIDQFRKELGLRPPKKKATPQKRKKVG